MQQDGSRKESSAPMRPRLEPWASYVLGYVESRLSIA